MRTYILPLKHIILILVSVMISYFNMVPQLARAEDEVYWATTGERYDEWYRSKIDAAVHACDEAGTRLKESEKLLQEARTLIAQAAASDMKGRFTARQAEWKAQSAIRKNRLDQTRSCSRATTLRRHFLDKQANNYGYIAVPLYTRGEVKVKTWDGSEAKWDGNTPLRGGESIKTGADGYAEISFPGSPAEIHMGSNSEFFLDSDILVLQKGRFYYVKPSYQNMKEAKDFLGKHVKIPEWGDVILIIKGTRFVAVVKPGETSSVALIDGELAFRVSKDKEVILHGGEQVLFQDGKILRGPEPLNPAILKE